MIANRNIWVYTILRVIYYACNDNCIASKEHLLTLDKKVFLFSLWTRWANESGQNEPSLTLSFTMVPVVNRLWRGHHNESGSGDGPVNFYGEPKGSCLSWFCFEIGSKHLLFSIWIKTPPCDLKSLMFLILLQLYKLLMILLQNYLWSIRRTMI